MNEDKLSHQLKSLLDKALAMLRKLQPYNLVIFLAFVLCIYSFVLFRAHTLNSEEPNEDAVASHVKAARLPHIDQSVVKQLQTLRDNSVNVQALFDQGRSNPFR